MKHFSTDKISVFSLVLLITGAIDSIRNLPPTALFGSSLIFFFVISALVFLIPIALVSAELSSTWSEEEGGVYSWVDHAFGKNWAFFTVWLQWINTIVWYPVILSFIAGLLGFLISPDLAQNKYYIVLFIIGCYWGLTILGLTGLRASAAFASFCAIFGMILPMAFIIILALIWLLSGHPLAISFDWNHLIPDLANTHNWAPLTAIMTSFLGMELAAVHVRNVDNPQRSFPKAMFLSVGLILFTMTFGSLAIAFVLPKEDISLVNGVMQAFSNFLQAYHLEALLPILVIQLLLGSLGSMVNWIISPAKGLLLAANHGYLPSILYRQNQRGVASRILILQAILVTLLCSGFLLFQSVNAIYWLFTDLSTELYVLMYLLMFLAAIRLKSKFAERARPFAIPGGKFGYYLTCLLGLFGTIGTLVVGFIPPEEAINIGNASHYRLIFGAGMMVMIVPAWILYLRRKSLH